MEIGDGIILAHDPGGGETQFVLAILGDLHDLGIKLARGIARESVAGEHAVRDLRKRVLDFAGMFAIDERFLELRVIEGLAEPGGLPEEKRHQDEQKRQRQDDEKPAALQAGFGGRGNGLIYAHGSTDNKPTADRWSVGERTQFPVYTLEAG